MYNTRSVLILHLSFTTSSRTHLFLLSIIPLVTSNQRAADSIYFNMHNFLAFIIFNNKIYFVIVSELLLFGLLICLCASSWCMICCYYRTLSPTFKMHTILLPDFLPYLSLKHDCDIKLSVCTTTNYII